MLSDEYPLLLLPIWRESLRQIQHVPEACWAFLRRKLASEDVRSLFAQAIMSYCDDLADLVEAQIDAQSGDAPPRDIARNREEGRNAILTLRGLVRFGLGISIEAVKLPDNFDDAVQQRRSDPTVPQVEYDRNLLTAELRWRVEAGPFVRPAQAAIEGEKLIAAVDGSSRTGVMSFLGEENDFYVGHAPMITVNTAVGLVNRRVRIAPGQEYPAFARLPEKPEDMQQRDNRYTVMTKLFFPDLSDAEYMHALWNGMDVLEAKTTLRVLSRWYTNPGGIEMPPSDLVMRDGTVVPQDRDFNHYKDSGSAGRIVRDMIELNWEIAKKCKDDGQTVAGVVKTANLRVFGPVLNWFVTQAAARKELGPIEAWPMRAMNTIPDQMLLTRLLTAERRPGDPWTRTALTIRPFHATTNFAKTNSIKKTPIERIHERQVKELDPSYHDGFDSDVVFWKSFRGSVDPYVQMLCNVAYASCYIATVPRLEVERYLPRIEFVLPLDVYGDTHQSSPKSAVNSVQPKMAATPPAFVLS